MSLNYLKLLKRKVFLMNFIGSFNEDELKNEVVNLCNKNN
jgi:hypothetical protein